MNKNPHSAPADAGKAAPSASFESAWRDRFDRFAARGGSAAKISGWSEHGLERRLEEIGRALRRWPLKKASRILDLGCGSGVYCLHLREDGLRPVGADFSEGMLGRARAVLEAVEGPVAVPLVQADVLKLPFADQVFEGLINVGVLQHIEDGATALREMLRVLEPGGRAYIITLNRNSAHGLVGHLLAVSKAWRKGQWRPQKHAIRRRPAEFVRVARSGCGRVIGLRGVYLFPRYFRWLEVLLPKFDGMRWPWLGSPVFLPLANAFLLAIEKD
ncbi:MAG: methyltransferase domain-containing protein [Planctomycetota bacterium]